MAPLRLVLALALVSGFLAGASTASATTYADLVVSEPQITDPGAGNVGDLFTWAIYVTNGGGDASAATLGDQLGDGESFVSADAGQGSCTQSAPVSCDLGTMAAGSQVVVHITVRLTKAGSDTNSDAVAVPADTTDPDMSNNTNSSTITIASADSDPGPTPGVETGYAQDYGQAHIDVDGKVTPYSPGTWWFEYGKTKSYGHKTDARKVSGEKTVTVKASLDGLAMDTNYHYRLVAEVAGKTYHGRDRSARSAGKQDFANLVLKAVKRGPTSTTYTGYFKDADLLDAPHACRGSVAMTVYTLSNVDIMAPKTRMNERTCSFRIRIPLGSSNARKYGPKGSVLAQAFFLGSYAIAHVGSKADRL